MDNFMNKLVLPPTLVPDPPTGNERVQDAAPEENHGLGGEDRTLSGSITQAEVLGERDADQPSATLSSPYVPTPEPASSPDVRDTTPTPARNRMPLARLRMLPSEAGTDGPYTFGLHEGDSLDHLVLSDNSVPATPVRTMITNPFAARTQQNNGARDATPFPAMNRAQHAARMTAMTRDPRLRKRARVESPPAANVEDVDAASAQSLPISSGVHSARIAPVPHAVAASTTHGEQPPPYAGPSTRPIPPIIPLPDHIRAAFLQQAQGIPPEMHQMYLDLLIAKFADPRYAQHGGNSLDARALNPTYGGEWQTFANAPATQEPSYAAPRPTYPQQYTPYAPQYALTNPQGGLAGRAQYDVEGHQSRLNAEVPQADRARDLRPSADASYVRNDQGAPQWQRTNTSGSGQRANWSAEAMQAQSAWISSHSAEYYPREAPREDRRAQENADRMNVDPPMRLTSYSSLDGALLPAQGAAGPSQHHPYHAAVPAHAQTMDHPPPQTQPSFQYRFMKPTVSEQHPPPEFHRTAGAAPAYTSFERYGLASYLGDTELLTATAEPAEKFPKRHRRDPYDLTRHVAPTTLTNWEALPEDTICVVEFYGSVDHTDNDVMKDLVDLFLDIVAMITDERTAKVIALDNLILSRTGGRDASMAMLLKNFSPRARNMLVDQGVWNTPFLTFFIYAAAREIPDFIVSFGGLTCQNEEITREEIRGFFKNTPALNSTLVTILHSETKKPAKGSATDRARAIIDTLDIQFRPTGVVGAGGRPTYVANVYTREQPTTSPERWCRWVGQIRSMRPVFQENEGAFVRYDERCDDCHCCDHVAIACPFLDVPDWQENMLRKSTGVPKVGEYSSNGIPCVPGWSEPGTAKGGKSSKGRTVHHGGQPFRAPRARYSKKGGGQ
ncbi:hypothetical protein FKP32DRAFT_1682504 [Trametes sanguinea]|nr:hypothetical protein FKP32DRAFT_1682504 [Trametes sanguinea]